MHRDKFLEWIEHHDRDTTSREEVTAPDVREYVVGLVQLGKKPPFGTIQAQ
jgi:hypothetical protein